MIVNMPDGKKVTFPDDVERSKVRDFINKKYPDAFKSLNIDTSKLSGTDVMNSDGLNSSPMEKLDTMLTFAGMLTKGNKKFAPVNTAITAARTITNTDYSKLGSEALRSLGRQTTELTAGSTGFYVKNAGRLLHDDNLTEDDFNKEQPYNTAYTIWKANQTVSDMLTNFGKSIEDLSDKVQNSDILKGDENLFEGSFEENPNLHKVIDLSMSGASSLVGTYAVSKVANPTVALYFMSGADAKDVLEESLEAGKSKAESFGLWTAATIGTAKLEKFGFEKVFGVKITKNGMQAIVDSSKKTSEKILEGMLSEGAEEGLQTIWQNTVAKIGYDESRDIFQNALESAIGGALGGGLVSSFNYGIQAFKKKSADAGLSEQEQDNIVNAIGQAVADNPSLVDVPFQENMKRTYESFSKMIEEMGDTPERQRLIATKNALDEGYNKYYEEFKNYLPEEQAKANASLLRSSALFFSDLDGITVDEWFKTKAPQIKRFGDVSKQAKEFADNITPTKLTLNEEEINLFEALKKPELIKQYQEKDTRESLLRFIKKQGGAKDVGGDLKAMDLGKQVIGVINNKSGNSLDDLALSAWERGYFPEFTERPTVNDLLDAMREESFGKKRYAEEKKQGIEDYVNILAENLDRMGIDYKDMTPAEIEKAYNQKMAEVQEYIQPDTTPVEDFGFADDTFFQVADENARLDDIYPEYKGETININGQEKTVYNSNGDRIAKSKEALENFYKWFGDSKVVDEQGRPLVVYHQTAYKFDTFAKGKEKAGKNDYETPSGFFFKSSEKDIGIGGKTQMPVYLRAENELVFNNREDAQEYWVKNVDGYKEILDLYNNVDKEYGKRNEQIDSDMDRAIDELENSEKYKNASDEEQYKMRSDLMDSFDTDAFFEEWQNAGNNLAYQMKQKINDYVSKNKIDMVKIKEDVGGIGKRTTDSFIVFEPNQIKSTSNRGTYSESENIYYQFAGERARTAALDELNRAKQLESDGVDNEEIRQQTGWFKGADGKWRFEISDKNAKIKESGLQELNKGNSVRLEDILDHKDLYKAYPSLANIEVKIDESLTGTSTGAYVNGASAEDMTIYVRRGEAEDSFRKTLLHEIQHDIQTIEGFARGGNTSTVSNDFLEKRNEKIQSERDAFWENKAKELLGKDAKEYLAVRKNSSVYSKKKGDADEKLGKLRREHYWEDNTKKREKLEERINKLEAKHEEYSREYYKYSDMLAGKYYEIEEKIYDALKKEIDKNPQRYKILDKYMGGLEGYKRLYGEIEARNTETRMDYTEEERRAKTPESTQDVANADAIVIFDDGTAMSYKPETYYQSAFAGSRVDYDRPSLEAIGSGEGNQAHGWGLYYALNKDVAENYRETFVSEIQEMPYNEFGGKTLIEYIEENGKQKAKEVIQSKIKEAEIKIKAYQEDREYPVAQIWQGKLEELETLSKAVDTGGKGQVHEVDIPENPYLLDEQKTFREQSPYVKKQLRKAFRDIGQNLTEVMKTGYVKGNPTGGQLYGELMSFLDGDAKKASLHLEKHGIKGITYDGRQDGRCFVIFNPADVKVIQKFYQNERSPLGAYVNRIIYLNETANASTLPHELAHFWSDELKRSKSLRAKEILRQADVWENREFERKYKIVKQENGFAVTDKDGKTVYDKMGDGFATEEQAKAYAKEELFARGFEKYIKEGKAPNKTLKQAFRNFYNWLKKIYVDMLSLDIKLSPNMRNLYADILGGTSIDTFLDSEIDDFIDKRTQAEEDKSKQVQGIIQQAQANDVSTMPDKIRKAWQESDWGDIWKKIAIPLSTRAKRISPRLRTKIRQYEFDVMDAKQNYYREAESMLKKWDNFSKEDRIAFDLALKNSTTDIRDEILNKYNATEDFAKVQKVLEDIYEQALDAGLEVGYLEDYFPRKVIDKDGLMTYLHNTEEWSGFQQALQREDPRGEFSAEEQAEFIDKYLRGIVRADLASYKYSSEKQRKLDIIDNNINQYYADSMQALLSYIDGMNARIQTSNFFGRNRQNIDESIGEFIAYMLNNGEIKPSQVDEVKNILTAVFKRRGVSSKGVKFARDISYIYTMGGINTAITQLDDWFVAAYKGGAINTIKAVFSKDVVTKKDLGLDSIAAEFMNGTGTAKAVNWVFKHNGIELIDGFGKNALLNGTLRRLQSMSDAELRDYVEPIMEERTDSTIADIRNKNLSKDVRFFLFNEMSDMQPVSLSELPELYNVGGNARIFYMLKSFMLKRIDTIRNECYDKIRSGDKAERIKGWQNLYKLAFLMMLGGATKDLIIDLMYRRVVDISDMMVNNLLGMVGISKYNIYQVREEGLGHTLAIFATPPLFQVFEDLSGDVNKYIDGKRELKDFEVFKGLPMIGRFYYWWIGGGHTKTEKRKKKKGS